MDDPDRTFIGPDSTDEGGDLRPQIKPTASAAGDFRDPGDGEGPDDVTGEEALDQDLSGRTLDDFRVLRTLGQGGMARVYLAEQESLRRQVALKVMQKELLAKPDAVQRFRSEAMAAAGLSHGNIVQVYTVGESDGEHYIAMEYVPGRNLRQWVRRSGPLPLVQAIKVMRQAASALKAAGDAGIVHRDIKPANLLISRRGVVKIADFGLSLAPHTRQDGDLTARGQTVGTPRYMSPEQVEGRPTDHRSDIYSLGVTFYYLLAGKAPYDGQTPVQIALQHLKRTPPPLSDSRPDLPDPLCELVHQMMARNPEDRPPSGGEVSERLKQIGRLAADDSDSALAIPSMASPSTAVSMRKRLVGLLGSQAIAVRSPRQLIVPLALLFAAGLLTGIAMRPTDPLARSAGAAVPKAETAQAQYVDAMFAGTPEAFAAVERHWPLDPWARQARQQRLLLLIRDPRSEAAALDLIELLERQADDPKTRTVAKAGRYLLARKNSPSTADILRRELAPDFSRLPPGWREAVDEAGPRR